MTTNMIPIEQLGADIVRRDQWGRYLIVPPNETTPVGYTRVTTIAKTLDGGGGLAPWKAAMTANGLIMRRGLRAQWEALMAEHGDPWYATKASKAEAKRLVEECAAVGGANDRREIGTALHTITALADRNLPTPHLTEETEAELRAYRTGLALAGVDVDYDNVELTVVLDDWRVAGTFDRLAIVPGFDLPLVADLKTGADLTYSWQSIAVQLAAYSRADSIYEQGAAKDGSADVRRDFPAVDQDFGLVMWLPAGDSELQLFLVDLQAGWAAFDASVWCRQWRSRKDLATLLSEHDGQLEHTLERSLEAVGVEPLSTDNSKAVRQWLQDRIAVIGTNEAGAAKLRSLWPPDLPTLKRSDAHTSEQLVTIEQLLDGVERDFDLGFPTTKPGTSN